jgi:hypothetical protein
VAKFRPTGSRTSILGQRQGLLDSAPGYVLLTVDAGWGRRGTFDVSCHLSGDVAVVVAVHDGVMTRLGQRRGWMAAGGVLLVAGVVGFMAVQTLDDADKWASVLSAVVAVVGLAVSVVTLAGGWPRSGRGGQSVTGSTVGGGVRQVRGVGGSVRIGAAGPVPVPPAAGAPTPPDGDGEGGGQSVDRSQVSGSVDQIDQVGGDVELDR